MTDILLVPSNDFATRWYLTTTDPVTGVVGPLITGPVRAFIALASGPDATPADPTLDITATDLGNGTWLVFFGGAVLTPSLLASLFGTGTKPVLIIVKADSTRRYVTLKYQAQQAAVIT